MSEHDALHTVSDGHDDGWMLLLPDGIRGHVVCLDDGGQSSAALAPFAQRLTVVCATAARADALRQRVAHAAGIQVDATTLDEFLASPLRDPLAGLVLNLLAVRRRVSVATLRRLARHCVPAMGYESFVYLAAANRLGYTRVRGLPAGSDSAPQLGPRQVRSVLSAAGVRGRVRWHPLLSDRGRVRQVLTTGGYRSHIEAAGFERLRELLLGRIGRRWVAPGFAAVGHLGTQRPSVLDNLRTRVAPAAQGRVRPLRYLASGSKIIVTMRAPGEAEGRVLVLPRGEQGLGRRRHEIEVLRRLGDLEHVSGQVPAILGTGALAGQPYAVMQEIAGVSVDGPVADLDALTEHTAGFLTRLHGCRCSGRRHESRAHRRRFTCLVEAAVSRYPAAQPRLRAVDALMWEALRGQTVPQVWEHGDFKIENVIIDRATRQLRGVIDWELACERGLPLVDLLYLLVYNRGLVHGDPFHRACREVVLPGAWNDHERRLLERYRAAVPMSDQVVAALCAFFPIHAAARRLIYDMDEPRQRGALLQLVGDTERACGELLAPPIGRHTGTEG